VKSVCESRKRKSGRSRIKQSLAVMDSNLMNPMTDRMIKMILKVFLLTRKRMEK
jgi:hypothetical protein